MPVETQSQIVLFSRPPFATGLALISMPLVVYTCLVTWQAKKLIVNGHGWSDPGGCHRVTSIVTGSRCQADKLNAKKNNVETKLALLFAILPRMVDQRTPNEPEADADQLLPGFAIRLRPAAIWRNLLM